jgi:hypothetical protein
MSATLESLVGMPKSSPKVEELLRRLGSPSDRYRDETSTHIVFHKHGIELKFNEDNVLTALFLFATRTECESIFNGQLPLGVRFGVERESIRTHNGIPHESSKSRTIMGEVYPGFDRYINTSNHIQICYDENDRVNKVILYRE